MTNIKRYIAVSAVGYFVKAKSGEEGGSTSVLPPEVVTAGAKAHGALQGKDSVPVTRDWTRAITEVVTEEKGFILDQIKLMGNRMDCWLKIAEIGRMHGGAPEVVKKDVYNRYASLLKTSLIQTAFESLGLKKAYDAMEPDARVKADNWPEQVQTVFKKQIAPRIAETSRVMSALDKQYTQTVNVLQSKGTVQTKLLQLPKVTARGRKAGTPNAAQSETGAQQAQQQVEQQKTGGASTESVQEKIADAMLSQVPNLAYDRYADVLAAMFRAGHDSPVYKTDEHFRIMIDRIGSAVAGFKAATSTGKEKKAA